MFHLSMMLRMMLDRKNIIIAVLIVVCGILAYIAFKPEEKFYDKELLQKQYDSLDKKYVLLDKKFTEVQKERDGYKTERDSLKKLPEKIKTEYDAKNKKIDKMGSTALNSEFEKLFSDNDIK